MASIARHVSLTSGIAVLALTGVSVGQGGEDAATATVIESLPFVDVGTTVGFVDDSDEVCPYTGSTSPDVYYRYTPSVDEFVDIELCESAYDTKVYIYDESLALVACNDDACSDASGSPFRSLLSSVELTAGELYYIVVDGWLGDFGSYVLGVTPSADQCPFGPPFPGAATALAFDGVNDHVRVTDAADLRFAATEVMTFETWIRPELVTVFGNIFTKSSDLTTNYALRYTNAGQLHFFFRNEAETGWFQYSTPDDSVTIGRWQHVALSYVFGGEALTILVDGQTVVGEWGAVPDQGPLVTAEPLFIGGSENTPGGGADPNRMMSGLLKETRLWRTLRTQEQIQAAMDQALTGSEPGLVGLWPMSEGEGKVATDLAGGHDGAIVEATWRRLVDCDCPADLDLSGGVGFGDLLVVLSTWGPCAACAADIDGSSAVDFGDLLIVLSNWGPCPDPTGACCLPSGACENTTAADCAALGGDYQEDDTLCGVVTCDGPNGWVVNAPFTWTGNTCPNPDDCDLRLAPDERWQVNIPADGDWRISVCPAAWDTWMAIGTTPCTSDVAFNDDFCGVASEITATLAAGTYYITLEGFSEFSCGTYTLSVLPAP